MARFCANCGAKIEDWMNFCQYCGTPVPKQEKQNNEPTIEEKKIENQASTSVPVQQQKQEPKVEVKQNTTEQKNTVPKKKSSGKGFLAFIAIVLVAAILITGFWMPGFFLKKNNNVISTEKPITFEKSAYKTKGVTANVNYENPNVDFDNGVSVSFGEGSLYNKERKLEVKSLGNISDDNYEVLGYDFTLDGKEEEFANIVTITLPYDTSWGDNVYVRYFNEEISDWETVYFEIVETGKARFYTKHFCTFAVFKNKVENPGWFSPTQGDLIIERKSYFSPTQYGLTDINTKVDINWDVLAYQVRSGKLQSDAQLKDLTNKEDAYFAERALTVLGNSVTGLEEISKLAGMKDVAGILGPLGKTITVGTFLFKGHQKGWKTAVQENGIDVALVAGSFAPPPYGTVCAAIGVAKFLYDSTTATVNDINKGGQDSIAEYAFREYTRTYVVYNTKTGKCRGVYYDSRINDYNVQANEIRLTCAPGKNNPFNANWLTVFNAAKKVEEKGQMKASEYIEMVIDSYLNAFWSASSSERNKFLKDTDAPGWFTGNLIDGYEAPSKDKINQYKRNLKNDLNAWLAEYYEKQLENEYLENLNRLYKYYSELEKVMNTTFFIEVKDPKVKEFSDSEFYPCLIGLSKTESDTPVFTSEFLYQYGEKEKKGEDEFFVGFSGYSWIKAGCPSYLRVVDVSDKDEDLHDPIKLTFQLKPTTLISVELKSEGDISEKEILGTWTIDATYSDMDSPLVAWFRSFFDSLLGDGAGEDIVQSNLDKDTKMTQTLIIEKKSDKLYITFKANDDIAYYTGTFKKGVLKLRYTGGTAEKEAFSYGIENLEYKFVREKGKVIMKGSFKINTFLLKANYSYVGTKKK